MFSQILSGVDMWKDSITVVAMEVQRTRASIKIIRRSLRSPPF